MFFVRVICESIMIGITSGYLSGKFAEVLIEKLK
jgi:hypothetical protein